MGFGAYAHTRADLESHSRLHMLSQLLGDALVKIGHDAHSQLWLDASTTDQVIESIGESNANARPAIQLVETLLWRGHDDQMEDA